MARPSDSLHKVPHTQKLFWLYDHGYLTRPQGAVFGEGLYDKLYVTIDPDFDEGIEEYVLGMIERDGVISIEEDYRLKPGNSDASDVNALVRSQEAFFALEAKKRKISAERARETYEEVEIRAEQEAKKKRWDKERRAQIRREEKQKRDDKREAQHRDFLERAEAEKKAKIERYEDVFSAIENGLPGVRLFIKAQRFVKFIQISLEMTRPNYQSREVMVSKYNPRWDILEQEDPDGIIERTIAKYREVFELDDLGKGNDGAPGAGSPPDEQKKL